MQNRRLTTSLVVAGATIAGGLAAGAPAAQAAGFTCSATAVKGALLGQTLPAPVSANVGETTCKAASAGGDSILPEPLGTSAVFARTAFTGSTPQTNVATAEGGLADLRLLPIPDLPIQAQLDQLAASVPKVEIPVGPLATLLGMSPNGVITLDISQALRPLLQPKGELLRIRGGTATAVARCDAGKMDFTGTSRVLGVSLLGQELPVDEIVRQTVSIVGGGSVSLANLDLTKIIPQGIAPELVAAVQARLATVLRQLPPIQIPELLANVRITPGKQVRTATGLTQTALDVKIAVGGQPILDAQVGEASVGAEGIDCAGTPPQSVSAAALQCTTRRLTLIDVFQRNGRVQLYGAADKRYVGRTVDIFFRDTNKRVARAKVLQNGTFKTTAKLPARKVRGTNRARYQARLSKEKSLDLKLQRRMVVESVRVASGKVRISGTVVKPLANPTRTIEVRQRVSCSKMKVVARVKPDRNGKFSVTVDAPPSQLAAVYRFATKVRKTTRNPKTYPTFTLPRYVDLS